MNIISLIQSMPDYIGGKGVRKEEIEMCEKSLGTVFAAEYKLYLKTIGLACFDGRELTGICESKRLNVVSITCEERDKTPTIPTDWYVIEQTNFDGIVVWQECSGRVYQMDKNGTIQCTYNSLCDYIENS
jgi:hypothetical protein